MEGNSYATTRTIVAAYQMIMPGERARSHRHTPNALRLIVDAVPGIYTVVDGKKLPMLPGDVVLTPNWSWHGHGNDSTARGYWIDFLDVPFVQMLEPIFLEQYPDEFEDDAEEVEVFSPHFSVAGNSAQVERGVRHAWCQMGRADRARCIGPRHDLAAYDSPAARPAESAKASPPPTRSTRSWKVRASRSSAANASNGHGETSSSRPPGTRHHHRASTDAVLFQVTDRPILQKTGPAA
ncbi:MAG: cupin domain-containing protein [Aliidongia sp.]